MATNEKSPPEDRPSTSDEYTSLGTTTLDRYGRHSQAYRHEASGKTATETDLYEATTTYGPQLIFFRRQDMMNCLTIWVFRPIRDWNVVVKEVVGLFFLPVSVLYAGYAFLMFRWDAWRAGPYECDDQWVDQWECIIVEASECIGTAGSILTTSTISDREWCVSV